MKQKSFSFLLALLMSMAANVAMAYDAKIDGIYYDLSGNKATVTYKDGKYNSYSGAVTIPKTITYNGVIYSVTSIGSQAFYGCSNLTSVTIPNSVTSIGVCAFQNCNDLTAITIPGSVTSIENYAFRECSSLTSFTIPNNVTSIGYQTFYECYSLTHITIPNSVTSIDDAAFEGCRSLTSVNIPESVTNIGNFAFAECYNLTSINIPQSVTSVGNKAFSNTAWYRNQPDGLLYTGKVAYKYKGMMPENTAISIKDGTVRINDSTFEGCTNLTAITIPESVTSIGPNAFTGTAWLENQTDGVIYIGKYAYKYKGSMPENTTIEIENGTVRIAEYAFKNCNGLVSITIPESVDEIGEYAFSGCSSLTSVTFPESMHDIGRYAFAYCSSLTSVTIPEGLTAICMGTFYCCRGLTSVTIPESVKSIERGAFQDCESLTTITIPGNVTSVGYEAFSSCTSLGSVILSEGVESIGKQAFGGCWNLYSITIPESVTSIGDYAFSHCSRLNSIIIPENVSSIGEEPFLFCGGIKSIKVKEENTVFDSRNNCNAIIETASNTLIRGCNNSTIPEGVIRIGNSAFSSCRNMQSITIPESVTTIGNSAFNACYDLQTITIPESVTSIGDDAFRDCSNLHSIIIPESVNSIGSSAFYRTAWYNNQPDGLVYAGKVAYQYKGTMPDNTKIDIKDGTLGIAESAFSGCAGLTSINIPESVTNIGDYAIGTYGHSLTSVKVDTKTPIKTSEYAFYYCWDATLYVPKGSKAIYEDSYPWCSFGNIVECNYLDAENINIPAGNSATMEIYLNNYETNLVAFQMDLTLPDGVGIDKTGCSLSSRITDENQELTIGKLDDGTYRLTSTSLSLTPISGNEGTLLTLKLTAEDGCVGGQTTISNIRFSTSESKKIIMSDESFDISILYNLTYMVDGEEYKTTKVAYGTTLTPEYNPTKEGHTFNLSNELPATMPNHDVVVTGSFSVNSYTLTYNVDGKEYKTSIVAYGTAITPEEEPVKEGYTFSGWSEIPETMPAHDVIVTGTFTINSYTLTYILDGEVYKTESVVYGTPLEPEQTLFKNGYTFSGWSEIPETMPAHDVTITGSFTINSYTLTYMLNDEIYRTETVVYGTPLTPEPALVKEGYTFSGWSAIPETMPAHDVIVTGTLTINSYTLTYIIDGEVYKTSTVVYDTALTPEAEPTKEGHTFSGWSEIPETMPANDVTVTGTFTINSYTLTYLLDGEVYKTESVVYGTTITPESELTKEGYTFTGWSEQPETMPANDVVVTGAFYLYGDVNTDEAVDVVDVVDIARYVVATPSAKFREKLADLNYDNFVNIGDAVTLVNYIAGDQNFVKEMFAPEQNAVADALSLTKNGKTVALNLTNGRAYTAFQFDLYVPEDANIAKMMLSNQRKQKHQLLYNKVEDGHYRVAALSISNNTFQGTEGELLSFVLEEEINVEVEISDIHFFDTKGNDYTLDVMGIGQETGVNSLQESGTSGAIYDLQGRKLSKMQRGVNIVDGKKVIMK